MDRDLSQSTLYITLEPCSTQGRTPPCSDLILSRGVGRVVVGVLDPNPKHAGAGMDQLRAAGVEVVSGVLEAEAAALIAPFTMVMTKQRPFVTLKLAMSIDGKIADAQGASKWLTGEQAREVVQSLRRKVDAVMVGAGTVRADNPSLLPRPADGRAPWRIILGDKVDPTARVLTDEASERTLFMQGEYKDILHKLSQEHHIMHVLCEGGGETATALLEAELIDELIIFIAPRLMGDDGRSGYTHRGDSILNHAQLRFCSVEQVGDDIMIHAKMRP
jgi:diaminohydroxyphosphoribosylaminopyrimidine deaminase/5-amino-6-(5-phosphoribosylamino)uracil reductase